jgi:hypothetical protein
MWNRTYNESNNLREVTVMSRDAFNLIRPQTITKYFVASRRELVDEDVAIIREHSFALKTYDELTRSVTLMEGSLVYRVMNEFCLRCCLPLA